MYEKMNDSTRSPHYSFPFSISSDMAQMQFRNGLVCALSELTKWKNILGSADQNDFGFPLGVDKAGKKLLISDNFPRRYHAIVHLGVRPLRG